MTTCMYCNAELDMQWKMETHEDVQVCRECFIKDDPDNCQCQMRARKELEDQYDWLKDCMCMYHWMQTDHYRAKGEKSMSAACVDCGLPYVDFPLDLLLPRSQWLLIFPESEDGSGLLCARCIVARAAKVPGATAVHAVIEIAPREASHAEQEEQRLAKLHAAAQAEILRLEQDYYCPQCRDAYSQRMLIAGRCPRHGTTLGRLRAKASDRSHK